MSNRNFEGYDGMDWMFLGPWCLGTFFGPVHVYWTWPYFFWTWGEENCGRRACVFSGPCGDIFFDLVFVLDLGEFLSTAKLIVFEPGFFFSRMRVAKGVRFTSGVWAGG